MERVKRPCFLGRVVDGQVCLSSGTVERSSAQAFKDGMTTRWQTKRLPLILERRIVKAKQQSSAHRETGMSGMRRAETIFIKSAVVILVLTALAKLISASGGARALEATDPFLMPTHRQVFLLLSMIELAIAAFLIVSSRQRLRVPVIAPMAASVILRGMAPAWTWAKLHFSLERHVAPNPGNWPRSTRVREAIALAAVCLCSGIWPGYSGQYSVSGNIKVNAITKASATVGEFRFSFTAQEYSFSIMADGCRWWMEIVPIKLPELEDPPPGASSPRMDWSMVAVSDGNEYCVFRKGPFVSSDFSYDAIRGSGSAPFGAQRELVVLWYTYLSHCTLANESTRFLLPLEWMHGVSTMDAFPVRYALFPEPPHLPSELVVDGYSSDATYQNLLQTIDSVHTNAILRVIATAAEQGLLLPRRASVYYYTPTKDAAGPRMRPSYFIDIAASVIEAASTPIEYPPRLVGRYHVSDYRFGHSAHPSVSQFADSSWPANPPETKEGKRSKGFWLVPFGLLLFFFSPGILLLRRHLALRPKLQLDGR
jgi:hypothetical protein